MTTPPTADRRTFLRLAGATTLGTALAGCSAFGADEYEDLVLDPPEEHDRIADADIAHPIYGEELPEATVPSPLHDRSIATTEFVGDRHAMLTFLFTSCGSVCPGLTAALRRVQDDAAERGYGDEIAFMPTTFDPEYDTADVLAEYGEEMGVDFEADNWYFLRPETPERAREVVTETFGVQYERADGDADGTDGDGTDDHEGDDGNGGDGDHEGDGSGHEHDHERDFVHTSLVLLVNRDGLVERAYTGGPPGPNAVIEDARTVVEEW